jgi:oxygen-dependent protoporphyrinogen oxidase
MNVAATNKDKAAHIVVVGGGISGLAAAYRLRRLRPATAITLVEQDHRLGGKILSEEHHGFLIEAAADSFLARKPRGVGLCAELGIAGRLIGRDPANARSFVKRYDRLFPLPEGLSGLIPTNLDALADTPLISAAGRARLAQESQLPPKPAGEDESVAAFARRRLGRELFDQLVEPLLAGIYAGDASQLSLAATFPQLRQLELEYGSLLRGLQLQPAPPASPYPPFVSLPNGVMELVTTLVAHLERVQIMAGVAVTAVSPEGAGYQVTLANGQQLPADALILTTPAFASARLLAAVAPDVAETLAAIPYVSTATVSLAYATVDLHRPLAGYGYVIPAVENSDVLACTWSSSKWPDRAPAGSVLLRVYLGRYGRADVLAQPDQVLVQMAIEEIRQTLFITAPPAFARLYRWPQAMPQYTLGHLERVAQIERGLAERPGLFVAGAAYRGVGIPDCILSGETAAEAAHHYLTTAGS